MQSTPFLQLPTLNDTTIMTTLPGGITHPHFILTPPIFGHPASCPIATNYQYFPVATAINPFHPPKQIPIPSPHKRPREKTAYESVYETLIPPEKQHQEDDIYAEIQTIICLEAAKTRYPPRPSNRETPQ
jgi:hypothetical protein